MQGEILPLAWPKALAVAALTGSMFWFVTVLRFKDLPERTWLAWSIALAVSAVLLIVNASARRYVVRHRRVLTHGRHLKSRGNAAASDHSIDLPVARQGYPAAIIVNTTAKRWTRAREDEPRAHQTALEASAVNDFVAQLDMERGLIAAAAGTQDFREGTAAFLEKRKPDFS